MRTAPGILAAYLAGHLVGAPAFAQTVTPISELVAGADVTLSGTVEQITDEDEFILRDESGPVLVYIGPNPMPVAAGDTVTVTGEVDDEATGEVEASALTLADGSTVSLPRHY